MTALLGSACQQRNAPPPEIPELESEAAADAPPAAEPVEATPAVSVEGGQLKLARVEFETAQATIKPESEPVLDDLRRFLTEHPEITLLRIEGHTDNQGDADKNKRLSAARAIAVRQWLVDKGVDGNRLRAVGLGSAQPIASNDYEEGRTQNRRAEYHIVTLNGQAYRGESILASAAAPRAEPSPPTPAATSVKPSAAATSKPAEKVAAKPATAPPVAPPSKPSVAPPAKPAPATLAATTPAKPVASPPPKPVASPPPKPVASPPAKPVASPPAKPAAPPAKPAEKAPTKPVGKSTEKPSAGSAAAAPAPAPTKPSAPAPVVAAAPATGVSSCAPPDAKGLGYNPIFSKDEIECLAKQGKPVDVVLRCQVGTENYRDHIWLLPGAKVMVFGTTDDGNYVRIKTADGVEGSFGYVCLSFTPTGVSLLPNPKAPDSPATVKALIKQLYQASLNIHLKVWAFMEKRNFVDPNGLHDDFPARRYVQTMLELREYYSRLVFNLVHGTNMTTLNLLQIDENRWLADWPDAIVNAYSGGLKGKDKDDAVGADDSIKLRAAILNMAEERASLKDDEAKIDDDLKSIPESKRESQKKTLMVKIDARRQELTDRMKEWQQKVDKAEKSIKL